MQQITAIAVFAHGSRVQSANEGVIAAASELARRGGFQMVEAAFLELGEPDLPEAVRRLVHRGATRVIVIPYFLTLGTHLQRDLPRIVGDLRNIYKKVEIKVTQPLDGHPALLDALLDRAREVLDGSSRIESPAD
ncbi:MAG: sirohydrochlorin chelatase [Bryobacteraceae bacterium]